MDKREKTYIIEYLLLISLLILIPTLISCIKFVFGYKINSKEIEESPKISLYLTESSKIIEISLEEYVIGVVASEMPASFNKEALKAQAVAARTYAYVRHVNNYEKERQEHFGADICSDPSHCQAYMTEEKFLKFQGKDAKKNWQKLTKAVLDTKGEIIEYENSPINPLYHANSGGVTETAVDVWAEADVPYLKSVYSEGEDNYSSFESKIIFSSYDVEKNLKKYFSNIQINHKRIKEEIKIKEYTTSGRIKKIKIGNEIIEGTLFREAMGLKSTNFEIEFIESNILITVHGYGHGVGMSQCGADAMAKNGYKYNEIIKHYYRNVEIVKISNY